MTLNKIGLETVAIIKSTAPVLALHGQSITKRMYELLFLGNPELKKIFNMSHQSDPVNQSGTGEQVGALARALYMYASHVDNLSALNPLVERIVGKHTSLNVQAHHYPIVEKALFKAMGEVLGGAATTEVVDAWREAYWYLANILIGLEKDTYASNLAFGNSWSGMRELMVKGVRRENKDTVCISLVDPSGVNLPAISAGKYISLHIPELDSTRQYSFIQVSESEYTISAKRIEENGKVGLVSNYLNEKVAPGQLLLVSMPAGGYDISGYENYTGSVCLLSGGAGITPNLAMLDHLKNINFSGEVFHYYSVKNSSSHAFEGRLSELCSARNFHNFVAYTAPLKNDRYPNSYDVDGRLDATVITKAISSLINVKFFISGPSSFNSDLEQELLECGVPASNIHVEYFGSSKVLARNSIKENEKQKVELN